MHRKAAAASRGCPGTGTRRSLTEEVFVSVCTRPVRRCRRPRRSGPWWHGQFRPGRDQGAPAMHRPAREPSAAAAATTLAPGAAPVLLTRGPPPGSGRVPEGTVAADSAELTRHLTEDHDRIAREMNDVVIYRIFAAGLDLQAVLGLIGDQRAASKICRAIDELDQAIRDIRDTTFDRGPRSFPRQGGPRKPRDSVASFHSDSVKTAMQKSAG